ncbi:MAG TPA: 4Fe-4S double cluster binding domain-containing protein [Spirochaetota bacterium]|nr:4Fe-4S double cluster binding domain-containing protein [Spirochaetota bacterium]HPI88188.1 4Fe-4S double cluster binding domain-containing protein [Spirochaetota bacterium]
MITKEQVIARAKETGFADAGFTTAEPFDDHLTLLRSRIDDYGWAEKAGLDLINGTDPKKILPGAKSILVVLECYFSQSFPTSLESHFGRCYLDDDRVTGDGMALKIKALRAFLRDNGIDSKVPFNLPHRVAAARAGLGTLGKNCLFYAGRVARKSSWVLPVTIVIDREFEPDIPSLKVDCPEWCRNACISACPTRALKGNGAIDPHKCISYLTYYGEGITPAELREAMGMYVYGCDRCQNVCPRNAAWLSQDLPPNQRVVMKAGNFDLRKLLRMDRDYFVARIWPHMFYMPPDELWRWKMNVARAMGNSLDRSYVPDLIKAFRENDDERVQAMAAWALGRLGGTEAAEALKSFLNAANVPVKQEIEEALDRTAPLSYA